MDTEKWMLDLYIWLPDFGCFLWVHCGGLLPEKVAYLVYKQCLEGWYVSKELPHEG